MERKLDGKAAVIRLDVMSWVGRQAAFRFGVRAVPTWVLVDGDGQPLLIQVGRLRPGDMQAQVDELILSSK